MKQAQWVQIASMLSALAVALLVVFVIEVFASDPAETSDIPAVECIDEIPDQAVIWTVCYTEAGMRQFEFDNSALRCYNPDENTFYCKLLER